MGERSEGMLLRIKALGAAFLTSVLVSAVMLLTEALLCYKLDFGEQTVMIGIFGTYAAACLAGGMVCGKLQESRNYAWGLALGGSYFFALLLLSFLLGGETAGPEKNPASIFLICVTFGMLGGMFGGMKKRR